LPVVLLSFRASCSESRYDYQRRQTPMRLSARGVVLTVVAVALLVPLLVFLFERVRSSSRGGGGADEGKLSRAGMLRLFYECEEKGRKAGCPIAGPLEFADRVEPFGPPAVPFLLSILREDGVLRIAIFDAIMHIDDVWGTKCYEAMLLGPELTDSERRLAIGRLSISWLRELAVDLEAISHQETADRDRLSRAKRLLPEVLRWIVECPRKDPTVKDDEDAKWARQRLEELRSRKGNGG